MVERVENVRNTNRFEEVLVLFHQGQSGTYKVLTVERTDSGNIILSIRQGVKGGSNVVVRMQLSEQELAYLGWKLLKLVK